MGLFGPPRKAPPRRSPTKETLSGPSHAVPCPHCKAPNNFLGMRPTGDNAGWGAYGLEPGTVVECDHCNRRMVITNVQEITVITVRQAGTV